MTEKMLIVILSTNAPTKRMKFKAITEKKKQKKNLFLFYLAGFEPVSVMTVFVLCSLPLA